jgi:hypothetical protein
MNKTKRAEITVKLREYERKLLKTLKNDTKKTKKKNEF